MKNLTKLLIGALAGSLGFFGNPENARAQSKEKDYYVKNYDNDDFFEEKMSFIKTGINEKTNKYENKKMGLTILYYEDKNNDDFHESIRVFNCDKIRRLVIEDFYINQETGLVNYEYKVYPLTTNKWNKYFAHKSFLSYVKENPYNNLSCKDRKYYPNLTKQDLFNLYPGLGFENRVKRLINASKDKNALESMLKEERYHWSSVYH